MEASPGLRKMQRQTLCGIPLSEEQVGGGSKEGITTAMRPDGLQISWHDVFDDLPGKLAPQPSLAVDDCQASNLKTPQTNLSGIISRS